MLLFSAILDHGRFRGQPFHGYCRETVHFSDADYTVGLNGYSAECPLLAQSV